MVALLDQRAGALQHAGSVAEGGAVVRVGLSGAVSSEAGGQPCLQPTAHGHVQF